MFGEILEFLKEPQTPDDLWDKLKNKTSWNSQSPFRARLDWLLACNKVYKNGSNYCLHEIIKDPKDELINTYRKRLDIGEIGEQFVLNEEKKKLSHNPILAKRVRRVSKYAPRAGYDIQSYFDDGSLKFIEVKTTSGNDRPFEMTHNEWKIAERLGENYFIYRVTNVNSNSPILKIIRNPVALLHRKPLVWKIYYESISENVTNTNISVKTEAKSKHENFLLDGLPSQEVTIFSQNPTNSSKVNLKIEPNQSSSIEHCYFCRGESKNIIFIGYTHQNRTDGLYLCPDCLIIYRELLW